MAGVVAVDFRVGGVDVLTRAIRSVTQATETAARAQTRASQQATQARVAGAGAASAAEKAAAKVATDATKAAAQVQKAAAREVLQAQKQAAREGAREVAKAAAEQIASARKVAREQAAANREATRSAQAAARAWAGGMADGAGTYKGAIGRGLRNGIGAVAAPAALAAAGMTTAGIAKAARAQIDLSSRAAMIQNTTGLSDSYNFVKMSKGVSSQYGVDAGEVMGGLEAISGKAGDKGFAAMGNGPEEMTKTLTELAGIARSAGVSMTDLGDVVGTMVNRGAKGSDLVDVVRGLVQQGKDGAVEFKDLATMLDASSGALMRFQMGTAGRLTMAGGLTQMARTFGKKSPEEATNAVEDLARDMTGKADIIQRLTGGSQTTTHVKGKKTRKLVNGRIVDTNEGDSTKTVWSGGVEVGNDASRASFRDIGVSLPQIIMGAIKAGNAGKILGEGGIFTGNSTSIVAPLIQAATQGLVKDGGKYRLAGQGEKASITGEQAIKTMIEQSAAAMGDEATTRKDLANVMRQDGAKLSVALNTLTNNLGDQLAPAVSKLTAELTGQTGNLGKAAELMVSGITGAIEHPIAAAMTVVGASVAKSMLAQMVANRVAAMSVQAGVVNVTGGASVPTPTPGGAPATAAKAGAGLLATTTAVGAGLALQGYAGVKAIDGVTSAAGDIVTGKSAADLAARLRSGKGTEEDRASARRMVENLDLQKDSSYLSRLAGSWGANHEAQRQGGVSFGSLARGVAAPFIAGAAALQGGSEINRGAAAANADDLRAALAATEMKMAPGASVTIANVSELAAALPKPGRDATAQPIAGN